MIHNWLAAGPIGPCFPCGFFSALQTLTLNCDKWRVGATHTNQ